MTQVTEKVYKMSTKKKSLQEIKNKLKALGYSLLDESEYVNTHTKVSLIDNEGYKYFCNVGDIIRETYIPMKIYKNNPYTLENIQNYMDLQENSVGTTIFLNQTYKNQNQKLKFKCGNCGKIYYNTFNNLRVQKICQCLSCNRSVVQTHSVEYVEKKLKSINLTLLNKNFTNLHFLEVEDLEGYKHSNISLYTYIANKNSNIQHMRFHRANKYTLYNMQHYLELHDRDVRLCDISFKHINVHNYKIECICPECGEVFRASWHNIKCGTRERCYKCSQIEYNVKKYLDEKNINYIQQKRFDDCKNKRALPFDFYLPQYNLCIEVNGTQHYREQQIFSETLEHRKMIDNIKKEYCKKNNILFLELPYWDFYDRKTTKETYKIKIDNICKLL